MIEGLLSASPIFADFQAVHAAYANPFSMRPAGLALLYWAARSSTLPILDMGSGLTTLVLAAGATFSGVQVHAIEENLEWLATLQRHLAAEGLSNVTAHHAPLVEGVYDLPELPAAFGVVSIDGPQMTHTRDAAAAFGLMRCDGFAIMDDVDLYSGITTRLHSRVSRIVNDRGLFVAVGPPQRDRCKEP